ncbi:MAG: hypothetical protein C3F15_10030 [Holophagae bacterium]|nr:MAG: hypothetical protein C3F15_10030 [Holophagae bacterium]
MVVAVRRCASRVARAVLRSPGLAAWGVTGAGLAAFIVAGWVPRLWEVDVDAIALDQLLYRVRSAVDDARRVLGYDVMLAAAEIERLDHPTSIARYDGAERRVVFNADCEFSGDELLDTAGHECVHALFDQASLRLQSGEYDFWTCVLVEETAAYVIGADVAGRVRAGRGGDGAALRDALLQRYRRACDASDRDSIHQFIWRRMAKFGEDAIDPERELGISIHFPSASLVDEVAAICSSSHDPHAAASAIAGRFWPTPTPTPDPDRPWLQ